MRAEPPCHSGAGTIPDSAPVPCRHPIRSITQVRSSPARRGQAGPGGAASAALADSGADRAPHAVRRIAGPTWCPISGRGPLGAVPGRGADCLACSMRLRSCVSIHGRTAWGGSIDDHRLRAGARTTLPRRLPHGLMSHWSMTSGVEIAGAGPARARFTTCRLDNRRPQVQMLLGRQLESRKQAASVRHQHGNQSDPWARTGGGRDSLE